MLLSFFFYLLRSCVIYFVFQCFPFFHKCPALCPYPLLLWFLSWADDLLISVVPLLYALEFHPIILYILFFSEGTRVYDPKYWLVGRGEVIVVWRNTTQALFVCLFVCFYVMFENISVTCRYQLFVWFVERCNTLKPIEPHQQNLKFSNLYSDYMFKLSAFCINGTFNWLIMTLTSSPKDKVTTVFQLFIFYFSSQLKANQE